MIRAKDNEQCDVHEIADKADEEARKSFTEPAFLSRNVHYFGALSGVPGFDRTGMLKSNSASVSEDSGAEIRNSTSLSNAPPGCAGSVKGRGSAVFFACRIFCRFNFQPWRV